MDQSEFDKFADEYRDMHTRNIRASGESPDFFAEYKIQDLAKIISRENFSKELKILDFGAGIGTSVPFFKKYFPDAKVTCLDVSKKSLQLGQDLHKNLAEFRHFDGKVVPFSDNSFHVVFTACVFHHISPDEHSHLLSQIHRVLLTGGVFVIFEHNPLNPLTLHAVNTCPFDENAILIRASKLRKKMNKVGFQNTKLNYRIFFPAFLKKLRFLEKYLTSIPLGAQYYVAAKKNP